MLKKVVSGGSQGVSATSTEKPLLTIFGADYPGLGVLHQLIDRGAAGPFGGVNWLVSQQRAQELSSFGIYDTPKQLLHSLESALPQEASVSTRINNLPVTITTVPNVANLEQETLDANRSRFALDISADHLSAESYRSYQDTLGTIVRAGVFGPDSRKITYLLAGINDTDDKLARKGLISAGTPQLLLLSSVLKPLLGSTGPAKVDFLSADFTVSQMFPMSSVAANSAHGRPTNAGILLSNIFPNLTTIPLTTLTIVAGPHGAKLVLKVTAQKALDGTRINIIFYKNLGATPFLAMHPNRELGFAELAGKYAEKAAVIETVSTHARTRDSQTIAQVVALQNNLTGYANAVMRLLETFAKQR